MPENEMGYNKDTGEAPSESTILKILVPHPPVAEWYMSIRNRTYKIRVNVEKYINHFKDSFYVTKRKRQNEKTLHADLLLAGIAQLVTVMVTDKIHQHQYIRNLKPLIN